MQCELCPIKHQCPAYERAYEDNETSYHPQKVVRVEDYYEPSCPLVKLIEQMPKGEEEQNDK